MLLLESSDINGGPLTSVHGNGVDDMAVDHVPDIADGRTVSGGVGARSIKNFFRKRTKSTSSSG